MPKIILFILFLFLSGCSSIPYKHIHKGDSSDEVKEVLGEPDSIKEISYGIWSWSYQNDSFQCFIYFNNTTVANKDCSKTNRYYSGSTDSDNRRVWQAIGAGLQEAGNQMQQNRPRNCTTNFIGTTAYTHCY